MKIFSGMAFNRMELAGSLGDLGTILPLAVGMIVINGLDPVAVFCGVGLFYILSGFYFRVTCPVEPMKVISGYAIATGIGALEIQLSCLWLFLLLLPIGASGLIGWIGRVTPRAVIRGVQLSTGLLLISQGVKLIAGTSSFQKMAGMAEPVLSIQALGPVPVGVLLGALLAVVTLFFLDNTRYPAALLVIGVGGVVGLLFGTHGGWANIRPGVYLPTFFPYGMASLEMAGMVLMLLVLPQVPMTVGNAVIANADLSRQYFPETGKRVTTRALCLSMALANLLSFLIGGMPMCHGAGGLASRYRFGARTAGSNLIIGLLFLLCALVLGEGILEVIRLLPLAVLGVLLLFAGTQLGLTLVDITTRRELFVVLVIVGISIASNLAVGFVVGLLVAGMLRWQKLAV